MKIFSIKIIALLLTALGWMPQLRAAQTEPAGFSEASEWTSSHVQHIFGFPGAQPKEKGTLTLTEHAIRFAGKNSNSEIDRESVIAVGAGNQRVELWGLKGQLLRMAIPNGGGLAAATVMHHRVDMLTVEFVDPTGAYHGVVFFLPANEADRALRSFSDTSAVHPRPSQAACSGEAIRPRSVVVSAPIWDQASIPVAYRVLVYEHLVDSLRKTEGVDRVYRDGESYANQGCPEYSVQIAISAFRQGSQVKRAAMGPAGMFVGTTKVTFEETVADASGKIFLREQVKAAVRGESENTNVAAKAAKNLTKRYAVMAKNRR
jgi:hypothetical protein